MAFKPDTIVIHHMGTQKALDRVWFDIEAVDSWHQKRAMQGQIRKRDGDIRKRWNLHLGAFGYHGMIYRDGTFVPGRALDEEGSHTAGHNDHTWGLLLSGYTKFTEPQWETLEHVVLHKWGPLMKKLHVRGHGELVRGGKTCPGFDVSAWVAGNYEPLNGHVWTP